MSLASDLLIEVPLWPGSKKPIGEGWQQVSAEELQVRRIGGCGIGLRLDNLTQVDLDNETWIHRFRAAVPVESPIGAEGRPGRCGYLYRGTIKPFRLPSGLEVRSGHGMQMVIPPTIHPQTGQPYRWLGPALTDETVHLLPEVPTEYLESLRGSESSDAVRVDEEVSLLSESPIPNGYRVNTLISIGGGLRAMGHTVNDTNRILWEINTTRCRPALTPSEFKREILPAAARWTRGWGVRIQILGDDEVPLDDFLNESEPEFDWVIPDLLERGDRLLMTGGEGAGKTTMLRQLGLQVAAGIHPITNQRITAMTVLYIDLENPRRGVRRELRKMRPLVGESFDAGRFIVTLRPQGLDLRTQEDRAWLGTKLGTIEPDLVILGPHYKLTDGPMDEEAAKKLAKFLDSLREGFGFTLLMEAHQPHKATPDSPRVLRPWGPSLWMRWPEFGLYLGKTGTILHWRAPRHEHSWPDSFRRGDEGEWPWMPLAPDEIVVDSGAKLPKYLQVSFLLDDIEKGNGGDLPSERVIQKTLADRGLVFNRETIRRGIKDYRSLD